MHTRACGTLPRRVSSESYDDAADERRGSNIVLVADEHFDSVSKFTAGVRCLRFSFVV